MTTQGEIAEKEQGEETTSVAEKESTSKKTQETFTAEEHRKGISDALTLQGREHKVILEAITTERDSLKTQVTEKQTSLEEIQTERDAVKSQLDNLTKDSPEKLDLVNRDNALRASEKKIKDDIKTLETSKTANADKLALAEDVTRELSVIEIGTDYEGADLTRLSELATQLKLNTKEEIRKVANTLWTKKAKTEETDESGKKTTKMKAFSGETKGGTEDLSGLSPDEKLKRGFRDLKDK